MLKSGFGAPLADRDADADAAQHRPQIRHDLALLDQALDVIGQDDDVERLAGIDLLDQRGRQAVLADNLVPAGALELRDDRLKRAACSAGEEGVDFGRRRGSGHEHRQSDSCSEHSGLHCDAPHG